MKHIMSIKELFIAASARSSKSDKCLQIGTLKPQHRDHCCKFKFYGGTVQSGSHYVDKLNWLLSQMTSFPAEQSNFNK